MSTARSIENPASNWLEIVRRKVDGLRFGSVQITVHEGRVTLVESTEKTRLSEPTLASGAGQPGSR